MKNLYLDWGCYKVRVNYDPDNINRFDVYYQEGPNAWDGSPYRKLTNPELKAAMEAIYAAEKIKVTPMAERPKTVTETRSLKYPNEGPSRLDEQTRNFFARTALEVLLTKRPGADRKKLARDAFEIADEMMEAKNHVHVEVCKNCHQEVKP